MLAGLNPAVRRAIGVASALLLGMSAKAEPPAFSLENEHLLLRLSQSDGRLVQFTDRKANWNHIADQASPLGLWKLELRRNGQNVELTPAQAKSFQLEARARRGQRSAFLVGLPGRGHAGLEGGGGRSSWSRARP